MSLYVFKFILYTKQKKWWVTFKGTEKYKLNLWLDLGFKKFDSASMTI